jgi:hypothetical protein
MATRRLMERINTTALKKNIFIQLATVATVPHLAAQLPLFRLSERVVREAAWQRCDRRGGLQRSALQVRRNSYRALLA